MATKQRHLVFRPPVSYIEYYPTLSDGRSNVVSIVGSQFTADAGENDWRLYQRLLRKSRRKKYSDSFYVALKRLSRRDMGGFFETRKNVYYESGHDAHIFNRITSDGSRIAAYDGPVFARSHSVGINSSVWPSVSLASKASLYAKGATAISQVIPTNPAAGLGVALGELRKEGIPSIIGSQTLRNRARDYRDIGSEYLNVEFGWKPLISDVTDVAQTIKESSKILEQYERDSGRFVRRRYSFPDEVTTEISVINPGTGSPSLNSYYYRGAALGPLDRTRVTTKRTWFSGCFSYHLSAGDSARARMKRAEQEASKLLGLRLNPDLLYQLAPWSWFIDWNSNLGDIVRNVSAFSNDGLVMRWGYIMCTTSIMDTYQHRNVTLYDGTRPITQTFGTIQKQRYKATPYGFGLSTDAFTTRQWAVIAALGISKGPRQL